MPKTVIEVTDLSKRFMISHDAEQRHHSFREMITNNVRNVFKKRTLQKTQEEFWALRNLNLEIKQGDCVGIVGRNGAGKSTLLKILSRITEPTSGRIDIEGRVASLLEVGTGFHPELTGRENIFLNGAILGMSRAEIRKKFDEIVAFAEVEKFLDTPVKRYSSGMYVRLAFAVAAHLEPEILVVDEVLAVGDAQFQRKCLGKMQDVSKNEGRTVLFVSHQMGAIRDLCTSCVILANGKKVYEGKTQEAISFYLEQNQLLNSEKELRLRKDRTGTGEVIITEINFKDLISDRTIDSVVCGEGLVVEIKYESNGYENELIKEIIFGLTIYSSNEVFLTPLNSQMSGCVFNMMPRKGVARCVIEHLPLMSGNFIVDAGLVVDKVQADLVKNAINLFVHEGDYYGFGSKNSGGRQGIFIDQKWSI